MADTTYGYTPGAGALAAIDRISGTDYPYYKVKWGAPGTINDASAANPFPVGIIGTPAVSGTVTANAGTGTFNSELGQLFGIAPTGAHKTPSLVIRGDTPSLPHANGTYTYLQVDATGKLWVSAVQSGAWNIGSITTLPAVTVNGVPATAATRGAGAADAQTLRTTIDTAQLGALLMGSVPVISGANDWKAIPANSTVVLETASGLGAIGDVFETIIVDVSNATAAQVLIGDGVTPAIEIFPAAPASGINAYQYTYGIRSKVGSWRIKTSSGCSAIVTGKWT